MCPRCGREVSSYGVKVISGRRYVFAYHGSTRCYLGPEDGYVHAERLWSLGLSNLSATDLMDLMEAAFDKLIAVLDDVEEKEKRRRLRLLKTRLQAMLESVSRRLME